MRILGLDPGSRVTGWGIVESDGWEIALVAHGVIRTIDGTLAERLHRLASGLREIIDGQRPGVVAIEQVFASRNARSALVLGHARGVALQAAAEAGLGLHEYSPMQVKNALTGSGRADKVQVRQALATQFGLRELPRPLDASDALAIAICHAAAARFHGRLEAASARTDA